MGKDLGTYHIRVELEDGRGWIERWNTGNRYTHGSNHVTKLDAQLIRPIWENEDDLLSSVKWMYTVGNSSCNCNKLISLAFAYQREIPETTPCGNTMSVKRLTVIRPDASEVVIFDFSKCDEKINKEN